VCPALSAPEKMPTLQVEVYSAQSKSSVIMHSSSSGGVFPILAQRVLRANGVVFGAAFDENLSLTHIAVEREADLGALQGSKYIQSNIGNAYSQVEGYLKEERQVLFTGLPCQVSGLYSYLHNKKNIMLDNLVTCQLVCYGVPSNGIFKDYVKLLEKRFKSKVKFYKFRDKRLGWKYYGVHAVFCNGKIYKSKGYNDPFMMSFTRSLSLRRCCFDCMHKGFPIGADIALGDFWHIDKYDETMSGDEGVSLVVLQTRKGRNLFQQINEFISVRKYDRTVAVDCNPSLVTCPELPPLRKEYFNDYAANGYRYCVTKYTNPMGFLKRLYCSTNFRIGKALSLARSIISNVYK
jgi:coenzyme F420-reducing hydrogenase beta subunit